MQADGKSKIEAFCARTFNGAKFQNTPDDALGCWSVSAREKKAACGGRRTSGAILELDVGTRVDVGPIAKATIADPVVALVGDAL